MTSGRQIRDPFYAYVGWWSSEVILGEELLGWLPRRLGSIACGAVAARCSTHRVLHFQVLYVVFISLVETEIVVDACIWDEFLVTAAVFERPTIAIPQGFAGFDEIHPFSCNKYTS